MSQSPLHKQLLSNDGYANPIATGTFTTQAINMEERRRLSLTLNFGGGHTGILLIQGTDETAGCQGTPNRQLVGPQPGTNGSTGALYWNTIPSGIMNVTNSTTSVLLSFTDVGTSWVRLNYNGNSVSIPSLAVGSGTISVFVTGKNT
jgi:hypothetical protein